MAAAANLAKIMELNAMAAAADLEAKLIAAALKRDIAHEEELILHKQIGLHQHPGAETQRQEKMMAARAEHQAAGAEWYRLFLEGDGQRGNAARRAIIPREEIVAEAVQAATRAMRAPPVQYSPYVKKRVVVLTQQDWSTHIAKLAGNPGGWTQREMSALKAAYEARALESAAQANIMRAAYEARALESAARAKIMKPAYNKARASAARVAEYNEAMASAARRRMDARRRVAVSAERVVVPNGLGVRPITQRRARAIRTSAQEARDIQEVEEAWAAANAAGGGGEQAEPLKNNNVGGARRIQRKTSKSKRSSNRKSRANRNNRR